MGPAPIDGIKRTNTVVVRGSEVGGGQNMEAPLRQDPFTMEVNQRRNYYACGGFGHMARNCRNRGRIMRVEIGGGKFEGNIKQIGHLKEVENLEALN